MSAELDVEIAEWEAHCYLVDNGLLDDGEPTEWTARLAQKQTHRLREPFTPEERMQIRTHLGLTGTEESADG